MRTNTIRYALLSALTFAAPLAATIASPPSAEAQSSILTSALAALERGEYSAAERMLAEVKSGPDLAAAKVAQARIELYTGRYDKAAETAKAAEALGKEGK